MAHLLEEYAKNLGVKFSKPIVYDHFFPLKFDKYITISQDEVNESKNYPYFSIVLNLLRPFLDRAQIKTVQLGGKSKIEGVDAALKISFKQPSFILSNSLAHVGPDGVLNHLASAKNLPTVTLFGNTFPQVNRPLFSKSSSSNTNLSPKWDKKPCLSPTDPQRQITKIKPEIVAQSILDFLKIEKEDISFSTKYIGGSFSHNVVEVVPTSFVPLRLSPQQPLSVRADYGFDENSFLKYCSQYKVSICAKKLIQPHGLQAIAANINTFYLFIDKDWEDIPDTYFNTLKNFNINLVFLTKNEDNISALRNKYFDIPIRPYYKDIKAPCEVGESTKFLSSLRIIEGSKEYLSYAHWKKGLDNSNKVLDTSEYWRESDHFYIYEPE